MGVARVIIAAGLLGTAAATFAPPAVAQRTPRVAACPPAGASVLVRGAETVVYRPRGVHGANGRACSRRTRKDYDLSHFDGGGDVHRPMRVARQWVVWVGDGGCDFAARLVVRVLNVRNGAEHEGGPIPGCVALDPRRRAHVRELVVTPTGAVGWIQEVDGEREVHKFDASGGERLDAGREDVRSLRARSGLLTWRRGGAARMYRLDRRARCGRRGSTTVERTAETRVYRFGEHIHGCLLGVGRHVRLGRIPSDFERFGVNNLRLAGPFAAFDDGFSGRSGAHLHVKVVDLRDGQTTRDFACCSDARLSTMRVLALTAGGAVAWTQWSDPPGLPDRYEVRAWADTEQPVVLDSITGEDMDSLVLTGTRLTWTNAGERRSAELR